MYNSSIVDIDIEKYNSIEKEREKIMSDEKFIAWLNEYKIGSRIEVKDFRAMELIDNTLITILSGYNVCSTK